MDFKEKIKKSGLKKSKIAQDLGITKEHFSRVLNNKSAMTSEIEFKLAKILK